MLSLIQRVKHASVIVNQKTIASIQHGLLILCGFEACDNIENATKLIEKCFKYRIFSDENGKMNFNLLDVEGEALLVPQFTLVANTQKGLRPSFSKGLPPLEGKQLFSELTGLIHHNYPFSQFGQFGADMQVTLCNDGPVTFMLEG